MLRALISAFLLAALNSTAAGQSSTRSVQVAVADENGAAVAQAVVEAEACGATPARVSTDYAGRTQFKASGGKCHLRVQKPGFYQAEQDEAGSQANRIMLTHVAVVVQQVDVTASAPGIDPQQISDKITMAVPEIVNLPYPTSRDIRNLLPFYPGVVQDSSGQVHVAGSETWATLDLLDGFNIRSPISGNLSMRFSSDAVRSIDQEATRYPVQYGRGTGGVIAFYTGMGDNRFRFNATNFIPGFHDVNGIRFDKFVPRFTFSGPIARDKAWFFDGLELEWDEIYVEQLPSGQNTNNLERGSNLLRAQWNTSRHNTFAPGLLLNGYHSPYDGLSFLTPQESTTKRNTTAWLPYARDQYTFANGALLDIGAAVAGFRDGYEPHAGGPFALTPELSQGAYFEALKSRSQRVEGNSMLYLPTRHWRGQHDLQAGVDLDHISYSEHAQRAAVNYLREDRTLLRQSLFSQFAPYTRHNVETGAYVQDRWALPNGMLFEPGLRFDWDEIIRRTLWSPRVAAVWTPHAGTGWTKISAGVGLYYEHTQLEYLTRALTGIRFDTEYAADGVTPLGPSMETTFIYDQSTLREPRALYWSAG